MYLGKKEKEDISLCYSSCLTPTNKDLSLEEDGKKGNQSQDIYTPPL